MLYFHPRPIGGSHKLRVEYLRSICWRALPRCKMPVDVKRLLIAVSIGITTLLLTVGWVSRGRGPIGFFRGHIVTEDMVRCKDPKTNECFAVTTISIRDLSYAEVVRRLREHLKPNEGWVHQSTILTISTRCSQIQQLLAWAHPGD
jgi:hypothetical protein